MCLLAMLAAPVVLVGAEDPAWINNPPEVFVYATGRSYLGVEIQEINAERVSALKLKEERGVEITMVDQDAPAGKAGLREHDVILEFNGTRVEGEMQLRRLIRETPPGREVALGISRDGVPMNINVQLGDYSKVESGNSHKMNHERFVMPQLTMPPEMPMPPVFNFHMESYTPALGIRVENLGQQLGEYFGVKDGEGLLVKSVEKGGLADKAGLKAGDVITRIDNEKVSSFGDLHRALRSHSNDGKINMVIVRDRHEQTITMQAPEDKHLDSSSLILRLQDVRAALERARPQIEKAMHLEEFLPTLRGCSAWRWTSEHNLWISSPNNGLCFD